MRVRGQGGKVWRACGWRPKLGHVAKGVLEEATGGITKAAREGLQPAGAHYKSMRSARSGPKSVNSTSCLLSLLS